MKLIIPLSSLIYCHIIKSAHMAAYLRETGGWLASGVPLLNKFFLLFISSRFRKTTMLAGAYVTRQHCAQGWRVGTRQQR
jgi:hypothetical protein